MYFKNKLSSVMLNFITHFYGVIFAPLEYQIAEGKVPRAKDLRSETLSLELQAKAVMKRERKAIKRKLDAQLTEMFQYNNHYQTN